MSKTVERFARKVFRVLDDLNDPLRVHEFKLAHDKTCKLIGRKNVACLMDKIGGEKADSLFDICHGRKPRHAAK